MLVLGVLVLDLLEAVRFCALSFALCFHVLHVFCSPLPFLFLERSIVPFVLLSEISTAYLHVTSQPEKSQNPLLCLLASGSQPNACPSHETESADLRLQTTCQQVGTTSTLMVFDGLLRWKYLL